MPTATAPAAISNPRWYPPVSALTGGYHLGFELAAGAVVVGIALALTVLRAPARTQVAASSEVAVEV